MVCPVDSRVLCYLDATQTNSANYKDRSFGVMSNTLENFYNNIKVLFQENNLSENVRDEKSFNSRIRNNDRSLPPGWKFEFGQTCQMIQY